MSKSILIIGGGIIGLSIAYYATEKGHRVTVVERGGPTHDMASLGNAGMIVPSHITPLAAPGMVQTGLRMMWNPESPFYIKPRLDGDLIDWGLKFMRACTPEHVAKSGPVFRNLSLASRQCYENWADEFGNVFGLVRKGLLELSKTPESLHEAAHTAEQARKLGIPAEVLTAEQVAQLEPNVRWDVLGGIYYPRDCHLSPMVLMSALIRHLEARGVQFLWNTEVVGWEEGKSQEPSAKNQESRNKSQEYGDAKQVGLSTQGSALIFPKTAAGEVLRADEVVIAGGAFSPQVARGLKLNLPMQGGKGYSLTLRQPKKLPVLCALFAEARVAMTPMQGALRLGGTMEIAGLDPKINPARIRGILKSVPKYMPEFTPDDFKDVQPWAGFRPCSPDGLPYVGRSRNYANLSVATGHAMLGISLGPITGKLMAQILSDEQPEIDLTMLNPDRYL